MISQNLELNQLNILGVTSLIFWLLLIIVSFKYLYLVFRFNNQQEGGILALSGLCNKHKNKPFYKFTILLGTIGTALFYGDGIITPAISTLGALEGLLLISPHYKALITPGALLIIMGLFFIQKAGSNKIGKFFWPIMLIWLIIIAALGLGQIIKQPIILIAINPYYGLKFLLANKLAGLLSVGLIILVITGVEALYADIDHFDKQSIKNSWNYFVFLALCLNYFGQGALLIYFTY